MGRDIGCARHAGRPTLKARPIRPVVLTVPIAGLAVWAGQATWNFYMGTPWTRDGTVRAYVVTMAPEVAGRIAALPVADNQSLHKGDPLLTIEPQTTRLRFSKPRRLSIMRASRLRMRSVRQHAVSI